MDVAERTQNDCPLGLQLGCLGVLPKWVQWRWGQGPEAGACEGIEQRTSGTSCHQRVNRKEKAINS